MKFLFDFFPVILFFIAFKTYGIYVATGVIMAASVLQISFHWIKHRKFETMHILTLAAVLLLGTATLLLHDERFIMWKPTLAYWLISVVFAGSHFFAGKKPVIQRLMGDQLTLPQSAWTKLNIAWIIFFLFCGALNLMVAYSFPLDTWVNFKLFGFLGLTILFALAQGLFIHRYQAKVNPESGESQS
jgi:intracellular septation protein